MNEAKVVKQSVITQAELKETLHYDPLTGIFTWAKKTGKSVIIGNRAGYLKSNGYITIQLNGIAYFAHRLAWLYVTGIMPIKFIDHKDGNPSNNWFDNLRESTPLQNMQNMRKPSKNNKTGFLGVSFSKQRLKFEAVIAVKGKRKSIGFFTTPELASAAYIAEKRKLHEFCTI